MINFFCFSVTFSGEIVPEENTLPKSWEFPFSLFWLSVPFALFEGIQARVMAQELCFLALEKFEILLLLPR